MNFNFVSKWFSFYLLFACYFSVLIFSHNKSGENSQQKGLSEIEIKELTLEFEKKIKLLTPCQVFSLNYIIFVTRLLSVIEEEYEKKSFNEKKSLELIFKEISSSLEKQFLSMKKSFSTFFVKEMPMGVYLTKKKDLCDFYCAVSPLLVKMIELVYHTKIENKEFLSKIDDKASLSALEENFNALLSAIVLKVDFLKNI